MTTERYNVRDLNQICFHVEKHKNDTEPWQIDFYTLDDILLFRLESDEETLEALEDGDTLYAYIAELMDFALMVGIEFDI